MNNPFHIEELDYSDPDNDSPAWEGIPDEVEEDDPDFEPNEADGDSDDDEEEDEEVQLPSHIPTACKLVLLIDWNPYCCLLCEAIK